METLKLNNTLSGHKDRIWCLSWNYNGSLLATCSGDKSIRIWCFRKLTNKWECISVLDELHSKTIRCVAWSPCGNFLATASFDGTVCIEKLISKDPIEFESVGNLASHNYEVKSVSWSPSGSFLATCARDKTVHIWEIDDYESPECVETFNSHTQDVKSVKWHPLVDVLVSTSYDNSIKIYKEELDEWAVAASLVGHTSTVWNAEFSGDGEILASCSDDRTVRLWVTMGGANDFTKWVCATVLDGYHERVVYDLSWELCSNFLATVSGDNSICLFRVSRESSTETGTVSVEFVSQVKQAHDEDVNCCSWHPLGETSSILATGSDDMAVKLWLLSDMDMPID